MSNLPAWIAPFLQALADRLFLGEWTIAARRADPSDPDTCLAIAYVTPETRQVMIALSADVYALEEPDANAKRILTHEMLHVFFADMSEYVMGVLLPKLYHPATIELGKDSFRYLFETKIDLLARILSQEDAP